MKPRELINLGFRKGPALGAITGALRSSPELRRLGRTELRARLSALLADPDAFTTDPVLGAAARALNAPPDESVREGPPAPHRIWGANLETGALQQLHNACRLPVAVSAALMPDAHQGYGLPIGGVLATDNAIIPYAVGVDIACRMRMTVLDMPADSLDKPHVRDRLRDALETQTRFGVGACFEKPLQHDVMDADWSVSPVTKMSRDRAWRQLGTSGSGNHFVEFGTLTLKSPDLGLEPGVHLALLSHSGSRGTGAAVCQKYSNIAREKHKRLPKELAYLAWLDLDSEEGREYFEAMNLMGRYAAANHECIHHGILRHLGAQERAVVENHHNFAWKETHVVDGVERELVVHRKGATPGGEGVLGVIPGSMAAPGFVVRGKGDAASLRSASHGAGRAMSRTAARNAFAWGNERKRLEELGVELLSAGIDEAPGAYKDIHEVMAQQTDLVDIVARFDPKLVKMAPEGERPED